MLNQSTFLKEVSVWNTAKTASEIYYDYKREKPNATDYGLVACFPLDEGSGSTVNDLSSTGINGSITGASWQTETIIDTLLVGTDSIRVPNRATTTAMFWQYSSRLGRRFNLDPKPNPSISAYATFANNPLFYTDQMGDTIRVFTNDISEFLGDLKLKLTDAYEVKTQLIEKTTGPSYYIVEIEKVGETESSQANATYKELNQYNRDKDLNIVLDGNEYSNSMKTESSFLSGYITLSSLQIDKTAEGKSKLKREEIVGTSINYSFFTDKKSILTGLDFTLAMIGKDKESIREMTGLEGVSLIENSNPSSFNPYMEHKTKLKFKRDNTKTNITIKTYSNQKEKISIKTKK